jgi:hypothetical protein
LKVTGPADPDIAAGDALPWVRDLSMGDITGGVARVPGPGLGSIEEVLMEGGGGWAADGVTAS